MRYLGRAILAFLFALVVAAGPVGAGIPARDPTVAYVITRSGSMGTAAGACGSRLACVKAAVATANLNTAIGPPRAHKVGLAISNPTSTPRDVDLGLAGTQLLVAPKHDGNANGTPDLADAINRVSLGGVTCFACGLQSAKAVLESEPGAEGRRIIIFIADRPNVAGATVASLAGTLPANTIVKAIAIGPRANCAAGSGLAAAAALTPGGTCVHTNNFGGLATVIQNAITNAS